MESRLNIVTPLKASACPTAIPVKLSATSVHRQSEFSLDRTPLTLSDKKRIIASSKGLGWTDLAAIVKNDAPREYVRPPVSSLWITYPLAPADITRTIDKTEIRLHRNERTMFLNRPERAVKDTIALSSSTFHLFIHETVLEEVAIERLGRQAEDMDWVNDLLEGDEVLRLFMRAAVQLLQESNGSAWRSGYLARVIAAHLIDRYATLATGKGVATNIHPLSARKLDSIREFMEENIDGHFKYCELAASVGLSRTSFFNRFSRSVNQTPHQYMQSIRIEKAKSLMAERRLSLAEIAVACGFADQSHMARLFRQYAGVTPSMFLASLR